MNSSICRNICVFMVLSFIFFGGFALYHISQPEKFSTATDAPIRVFKLKDGQSLSLFYERNIPKDAKRYVLYNVPIVSKAKSGFQTFAFTLDIEGVRVGFRDSGDTINHYFPELKKGVLISVVCTIHNGETRFNFHNVNYIPKGEYDDFSADKEISMSEFMQLISKLR